MTIETAVAQLFDLRVNSFSNSAVFQPRCDSRNVLINLLSGGRPAA
jgi:hypothetical protein